jgi:hypothetical protein
VIDGMGYLSYDNAAFASAQVDRLTHHSHGSRAVER